MAPPRWAEKEQLDFLLSKVDGYIEARKRKCFDLFWTDLHREWFQQWKEPGQDEPLPEDPQAAAECQKEVGELVKQRIEKLKNWFNNNAKTRRQPVIKSQFEFKPKPTRLPQASELYSAKYYKTDIQAHVDEEKQQIPKNEHIAVIRRKTREAFEAAPMEVRQKVIDELAEMKKQKEEEKAKQKVKSDGEEEERTTAEYAAAILELPDILGSFFTEISRKTGWVFSVMGGGPDPANGGSLRTMSHHCGTNALGHTFRMAHPTYQDTFLVPYAQFLQQIFPQNVCDQRSLHPKKLDASNGRSQASPSSESEQSTPPSLLSQATAPTIASTPTSSEDEPTTVSTCSAPQNEHLDTTACGLFYPQTRHCDSPMEGMSEYQQENTQTVGSADLISAVHVQTHDHEAGNWPNPPTRVIPHDASCYPDPATHVPHEAIDKTPAYQEAWHNFQGESGGHETLDPSLDPTLMDWTSGWSSEELNQIFSFDPAWQDGRSGLDNDMLESFYDVHGSENFGPTFSNISSVNKVPTGPAPSAADKDAGNPDSSHEYADNAPGAIQPRKPLSHVSCNISRPETATAMIASSTHKRKYLADEMDKENGATEDNNPARSARNRKPAASKEVLTLTETGRGSHSAASWLMYAEGYLRSDEALGPEWKDCIDSWLAFEQSDTVPGHLSETKLRPSLLSQWMQKRKYGCIPELRDPATFSKEWTAWWSALQPEWRRSPENQLLPISSMTPENDIRTLRRSGPMGIVTIIIALKWWGETAYAKEAWKSAVIDVHECLEVIVSTASIQSRVSDKRIAKKRRT